MLLAAGINDSRIYGANFASRFSVLDMASFALFTSTLVALSVLFCFTRFHGDERVCVRASWPVLGFSDRNQTFSAFGLAGAG